MRIEVGGKVYFLDFQHNPGAIHQHGFGVTCCDIWTEEQMQQIIASRKAGNEVFPEPVTWGEARCSAMDTFNKRKGRKIALSQALTFFPHDERREWWKQYFIHMPQDMRS